MNSNPLQTALILFTRTPAEEVRHKKLVPQGTPEQQYKVAAKLVQHSQEVLSATGLPYFVYCSEQQIGMSFGERLYNAFAHFFSLGYQQVIAIGNDCPQLKPTDILAATQLLPAQEVILGPDKAGGIYLLGLTKQKFQSCQSFSGIRWNTPEVLADALKFFQGKTSAFVLPVKFLGINNNQDLRNFLHKTQTSSTIYRYLKQLLRQDISFSRDSAGFHIIQSYLTSLFFRGPPAPAPLIY